MEKIVLMHKSKVRSNGCSRLDLFFLALNLEVC